MKRKFRISSLAMAGLTTLGAAAATPAPIPFASRSEEEAAGSSLFETFRVAKPVGSKQHRSHGSHQSHGSHRSSSGGARPRPSPRPAPAPAPRPAREESQSTSPSSVLPSSGSSSAAGIAKLELSQLARVQALLAGHGYYTGTIDGVDGPLTRSAISRFQAAQGLSVTGQVNNELLQALGLALD